METERKLTASAAYLPFATFISALDDLAEIGIPNKVERATFPGKSVQDQTQVISAFKFFDLIADDGTPKPFLSELAHKKNDERKVLIKQLLETHYPDIVALDFAKLTPSQLDQALSDKRYNIQGETKKKAKTFLLKAAQHAGFTVHPLLTKITRNRRNKPGKEGAQGATKTGQTDAKDSAGASEQKNGQSSPKPRGSERTVKLKSGAGSVTLILDVDLMELEPGDEQSFVLGLRDMVRAYEKGAQSSTEETGKVEKEAGE